MALVVLVGLLVDLLLGVGPLATVAAALLGLLAAAVAARRSDAVVLAVSRARPADPAAYARLHNLVEGLCTSAGLPKPRLFVVEDPAPNALATGRDPHHASVGVTTGLLERLDRVALEGVLAHELSRIKAHDTFVSTLAVTLVCWAPLLAGLALRARTGSGAGLEGQTDGGGRGPTSAVRGAVATALLLPAPVVARVLRVLVDREREPVADAAAAALTRYPPGLAAGLDTLRSSGATLESALLATGHLWIAEPLAPAGATTGREGRLARLFDTHVPLDARIDALRML